MTLQQYQQDIRRLLTNQWRIERKSQVTIFKNYLPALKKLLRDLPVFFDEITEEDLVAYCLTVPGINARDLQITMIRAVYRLYHNIQINWRLFPYIKRKHKIQPSFSVEQVQQLIDATENNVHKLMILTSYSAALRVGELVILKKKDLQNGCIFIDGEGINDDRLVPVPSNVYQALQQQGLGKTENAYLFPGQFGGHITTRTMQQIITHAKQKAGINIEKANTHALRRGLATKLNDNGTSILFIRDILGHRDVATTQVYIGVSMDQLKAIPNPAEFLML